MSTTSVTPPSTSAPLSHIRVLDLSRVLAAPWATQFLADMGADVIKIERPTVGDETRGWGPPFAIPPSDGDPGLTAYFMSCNRGKRSVAVDITRTEGQALLRRLVAACDVVVENFKVGGLAKYGLDYESLKAVNPRLVYCSVTGFGQTGPMAERAGYDYMAQGLGGLMSITGLPDGEPGAGPMKVGVAMSDVLTGWNAVGAILSALLRRERTGEGAYIDIALLDVTVAALINQASTYLVSGSVPTRMGNAHPTVLPYGVFETADGHLILATANDNQFAKFCRIVPALADMADDPRYQTMSGRIANRTTLIPRIAAAIRARTTADWMREMEARDIPGGPILSIDEVFEQPQVIARGMRRTVESAAAGRLPVVANPVRMTAHDTTAAKAPPLLGEDTEAVLAGLIGLGADEIARLRSAGIIG